MTIYEMEGGRRLEGELSAQGAKNAALPLLSAALLSREVSVLEHCPDIDDVNRFWKRWAAASRGRASA